MNKSPDQGKFAPENNLFDPIVRKFDANLGLLYLIQQLSKNTPAEQEISPRQFLEDFKVWKQEKKWTDEDITLQSFLENIHDLQSLDTSEIDSNQKHLVYSAISLGDQLETLILAAIDLEEILSRG